MNGKRINLRAKYGIRGQPVVTAHRGFSGKYPENTLLAFEKACELGADVVEFDVRESSDGALVIMHDDMLDRTTDGRGLVAQYRLAELKRLNASYWQGSHNNGRRTAIPVCEAGIPTLEEAFKALAGRVCLNIQVYTSRPDVLENIARLYLDYDLRDSGFLMLESFADGAVVRAFSPDVAICIGEDRPNLERHLAFGVDYLQPSTGCLTDSYLKRLIESGMPANVFFANDPDSMLSMIEKGIPGIITDFPDVLINLIATRGKAAGGTG